MLIISFMNKKHNVKWSQYSIQPYFCELPACLGSHVTSSVSQETVQTERKINESLWIEGRYLNFSIPNQYQIDLNLLEIINKYLDMQYRKALNSIIDLLVPIIWFYNSISICN